MTKIIGITGGIGSGKSTLSQYLKESGYPVHESDEVVADMYKNPDKSFMDFIKYCGLKNVVQNKKINKKIIAESIFSNQNLKIKIEKYIHKEVKKQREKFIKKNLKMKKKLIFLDIPLLLEKNIEKEFDSVLCIISTKKNRINRVLKNKKFSKNVLNNILKNQINDKERRERSNFIINNNNTKKDLIKKTKNFLTLF